MRTTNFDSLAWDKQDGLLPAIVQDANTLQVLMLGYMNREALEATQKEKFVTFFSRSKQRLWKKGETSGHVLAVVSIEADCDNDTLLIRAIPAGPTCHLNRSSCFENAPGDFIGKLDALLEQRQLEMPEGSYTTKLFQSGVRCIAQKVGEEGVETALAAVAQDEKDLLNEASDLVYHLMVLLRSRGLNWNAVQENLKQRHQ
ncbi:MAG TPA: bifunctional phosphoribosyl-AMP cyclohydrolase/phosphoribosyl-ATP diphosphatase HisIE [Arenimonas sp.]|nr:bifunctional phosphoribosyl-AMP cyclohydrolase/phosphoribosyl-ATP diphosphatase HisIE [Arenimonas sp.]HOZ03863.1 bifunctional phosphoribosyl-AMP cyclohydrolase/phosphoribosyl-ATP diphosphatase HisIE [Arenimonas sp.]HPO24705.1 bifunctional phosphoribosyl-AMP cyclohydrolase/phosphoribosyl-ATP diphosphatase HisIE [Arenimonas sp.]HPW32831.1 bifunctional phosphoribosyl-AMP cyclohydrolase/phosphoribosyl-ATP diphosphatase HisIE [Arenimonas sp.]